MNITLLNKQNKESLLAWSRHLTVFTMLEHLLSFSMFIGNNHGFQQCWEVREAVKTFLKITQCGQLTILISLKFSTNSSLVRIFIMPSICYTSIDNAIKRTISENCFIIISYQLLSYCFLFFSISAKLGQQSYSRMILVIFYVHFLEPLENLNCQSYTLRWHFYWTGLIFLCGSIWGFLFFLSASLKVCIIQLQLVSTNGTLWLFNIFALPFLALPFSLYNHIGPSWFTNQSIMKKRETNFLSPYTIRKKKKQRSNDYVVINFNTS